MGKLIHDSDAAFFKSVAAEVNELAGEEVDYYMLDKETMQSSYDTLYNEPGQKSDYKFKQPFRIWVSYEDPAPSWSADERGRQIERIGAQLWIAVQHWNLLVNERSPYPGDIIMFRNMFFDVTAIQEEGWLDTSNTEFTMWKLTLSWRSANTPDAKINCI